MTVKPIAAGTPQRIIAKINEIINAVNTGGGSGGSGTADAILDAATIADAGKALGIDAEGEPALINAGGVSLLRCNLTYTGDGTEASPQVGHLDHAAEILDALDPESAYDPLIVIAYDIDGEINQTLPTVTQHITITDTGGEPFTYNDLACYADIDRIKVVNAITIETAEDGGALVISVVDSISNIGSATASVVDNVLIFGA